MSDIRFSQATSAYSSALQAAESILKKVEAAGIDTGTSQASATQGNSFMDMVGKALGGAAASGYKSEAVATKAIAGKADITDVVTAMTDAETALNTVVAIRDRVISSYQDIIKMAI